MFRNIAKLGLINLIVFIGLILLVEILLRGLGYKTGHDKWYLLYGFKQVDEITVENSFFTDSTGMFRANANWAWDSTYNINAYGFRSRAFSDTVNIPRKNRLLLLGDSFTWGAKAEPIQNCYADLLDRETQYTTYNTGIPGIGPDHYSLLAERYIPILKPHKVLAFFYMGNDLLTDEMENLLYPIRPNENLFHITNAGWISAHSDGKYMESPEEAYQSHLKKYLTFSNLRKDPFGCDNNLCRINSLLNYTVLGTWLYSSEYIGLAKMGAIEVSQNKSIPQYTYLKYLNRIKNICEENDSQFFLFIIPNRAQKINQKLFKGLTPLILDDITEKDYQNKPNGHFNNIGHRKYFEFIVNKIN